MRLETSKSSADQNKFCIYWFLFSLSIYVIKEGNPFQSKLERGLYLNEFFLFVVPVNDLHLHSLAEFLSYAQDLCSPSQRSQDH